MLTLPDIRQHYRYDCGGASAFAVGSALGLRLGSYRKFLSEIGTTQGGTPPYRIIDFFTAAGVIAVGKCGVDISELRERVNRRRQYALCLREAHWIVILCVGTKYVHIHDPAVGKVKLTLDEFKRSWYDEGELGEQYHCFAIFVSREGSHAGCQ